ncbi:MAG: hypothetical protein ACI9DO_002746 [Reinekea sp.]|jgi:hypothetical protein|uniref:DUF2804 domain-containing protein n=3 Tax=Reinekea sp. TaxID=1970455 RepID=UPI003989DD5F
MNQNRIQTPHNVLDENGHVMEAGYSKKEVLHYDKSQVTASRLRLKEWDYFFVGNKDYGLAITIADNNYMGLAGFVFLDFKNQKKYDYTKMLFNARKHLNMPNQLLSGTVAYDSKDLSISYEYKFDQILIKAQARKLKGLEDATIDLTLNVLNDDHLVIVTPFEKKKAFYYNQKINHLAASGYFTVGERRYSLDDNFGLLDWGRGVWTYDNTWYWSSASGKENGHLIGFNLGYGFGNTEQATENILYYDKKGHKIDEVHFHISDDFISPWKVTSNDDSLYFDFYPIYDNHTNIDLFVIGQNAHQVFGEFKGYMRIDGEKIEVKSLFGFAEKVRNRW